MLIRKVRQPTRYEFLHADCLGRQCFAPGMYQHRSPLSCGGSRNTGSPDTPCCLNRAYHGCPRGPVGAVLGLTAGLPVIDVTLLRKRKAEGWRKV